jgi:hypothetical protein
VRRHPHLASTRRRTQKCSTACADGAIIGERGGLPTQITLQSRRRAILGQERRHAAPRRRGARPGRGRHERSVSLHRVEQRRPRCFRRGHSEGGRASVLERLKAPSQRAGSRPRARA